MKSNIYQKIVSTVRYRILSLEEEVDILDEETLLISHVPGTTEIDQKKLILLRNVKSVLHDTLLSYYINFTSLCPSSTTSISEATKFHIQVLKLKEMEILISELFGQQSALNTFVGHDYNKYSRDFCVPDDMKLRLLSQVFPFEFEFDLLSDSSFFEFLLKIVNEYQVENHEELIKQLFERISIQKPKSFIYFFTADSPLYFCLAEHFLSSFVHNQMLHFEWDPLENFSIYQKCRLIATQGPLSCSIKPSLIELLKSAQGNNKILEIIKSTHSTNLRSNRSFYCRPFISRFNTKIWNFYNNKTSNITNSDFSENYNDNSKDYNNDDDDYMNSSNFNNNNFKGNGSSNNYSKPNKSDYNANKNIDDNGNNNDNSNNVYSNNDNSNNDNSNNSSNNNNNISHNRQFEEEFIKKSSSQSSICSEIEEEVVKIRREKEHFNYELPQLWHVSLDLKRLSLQTSPSFVLCVLSNSLIWLTNAITIDGNFVGADEILEFFVFALALSEPKHLPALCVFTERFLDRGLKDETKFSYLLTQLSGALTFIQQQLLRVPPFLIFPFKKPMERLRGRMRRVESDIVMRGFRIFAIPTFRKEKDELFPALLQYTGNEDDVAICSAFSFSVNSDEEGKSLMNDPKVQVFPLNMPYFEVIPTIYGSFLQLTDEYICRFQMIQIDNGNVDDTIEAINAISIIMKLLPKGNNYFNGNHIMKLGDLSVCFEIVNRKWESRMNKNFARYSCQSQIIDNDETVSSPPSSKNRNKKKKKNKNSEADIEKVDDVGSNRKFVIDKIMTQKLMLLVAEMQKSLAVIKNLPPRFIIDGVLNSWTWEIIREMFHLDNNDIITTNMFDELVPK